MAARFPTAPGDPVKTAGIVLHVAAYAIGLSVVAVWWVKGAAIKARERFA